MQRYYRLLQYARPYWRSFVLILVATLAVSGLAALQPWPLKLLVDHVLGKDPFPSWLQSLFTAVSFEPTPARLLVLIVITGLGLFALTSALDVGLTWAWTFVGRRIVYSVAEDLFARLQRRSLLFHTRHSVGDTMGRITVDSWAVHQVIDTLLFAPAHAVLILGMIILLMAQLDLTLTALSLVVAPFMVAVSFLVGKPLRAAAKCKREIETGLQSHIQQTLTGIPVVQAFAQEERESFRFQQFADAAIRVQQRSTLIGSLNALSSGLITTLGTGIILWVGARHYLEGTLSLGSILIFLVYLNLLQPQMKVIANFYTTLQGLSASVDRITQVLDAQPEVGDRPSAVPLPPVCGLIQIDHVTFGYEPGRPVLRGISFEVRACQTLAIVGATGAGKTTLVNLVPRFFDPWEGCVRIDGLDVREVLLRSLRRQVALVLQEPFLFPLSVAENIAFGKPEATRAEIESAARAANAHEFIMRLPEGYDTVVGERGATLSGGERQRVSIARAVLKNAPILILDEPTSALDAETERSILEALQRLMKDRTTLLIAHRLSTVRRADRIVVLQDGRIEESGTHAELLARGRLYARLHNFQFEPKGQAVPATS